MIPPGWTVLPFTEVFSDASGGQTKTLARDFLSEGAYPLIDQGKNLIGGYSNDPGALCTAELPVILFGDHTRSFKYIDFPFGVGADGVKVLRPRIDAAPRYLYHYLRFVRLEAAGYDRHFKYLKRISVPLPPIGEQRRIVAALDQADELRAKRRAAFALLDTLTESIFLDMFGEESEAAQLAPLANLGRIVTGKTPSGRLEGMYGGPVPFVTPGDLHSGRIGPAARTLTAEGAEQSRVVPPGSTLVCCIGATIGKVGNTSELSAFNQQINAIDWDAAVLPDYGLMALRRLRPTIRSLGASTTLPLLNKSSFSRLRIPVPDLAKQEGYAAAVRQVDLSRSRFERAEGLLDESLASLQQRAFRGEL